MYSHFGKTVWRFLKKLKIELPYNLALLGIYPRDTGVLIHRGTCTPIFITALLTIAKVWKEPKCPSTDEWIKKMWCVCVCVCVYNHLLFAMMWKELEYIMLNEISQSEKDKYHMTSLI